MARIDLCCRAGPAERHRGLPGDESVPEPLGVTDHAVTIAARPDEVWPWLAHMGADRAGWYSYDFLDNGGRRSARKILPELQSIAPGSVFPALSGARDAFVLTEYAENRYLVLGVPGPDGVHGRVGSDEWRNSFSRANWTFCLTPVPSGTRLHVRARLGFLLLNLPLLGPTVLPRWCARLLMTPIHFIMQRKQLNEIRQRAEHGRPEL